MDKAKLEELVEKVDKLHKGFIEALRDLPYEFPKAIMDYELTYQEISDAYYVYEGTQTSQKCFGTCDSIEHAKAICALPDLIKAATRFIVDADAPRLSSQFMDARYNLIEALKKAGITLEL